MVGVIMMSNNQAFALEGLRCLGTKASMIKRITHSTNKNPAKPGLILKSIVGLVTTPVCPVIQANVFAIFLVNRPTARVFF